MCVEKTIAVLQPDQIVLHISRVYDTRHWKIKCEFCNILLVICNPAEGALYTFAVMCSK
jgi:hypothetical protein